MNQPEHLWDRQPGETPSEHALFVRYLHGPPKGKRTLQFVVDETARGYSYISRVANANAWRERAAQYDQHVAAEDAEARRLYLESARQTCSEAMSDALKVLSDIMHDAAARPRDRISAAVALLERGGLTVPKRVELSGPDGADMKAAVRAEIVHLSTGQMQQMLEILGSSSDTTSGHEG